MTEAATHALLTIDAKRKKTSTSGPARGRSSSMQLSNLGS
jgi:hypothetical protein